MEEGGGADDWDVRWREFATTNALNPATVYRRELVLRLLDLARVQDPVRLLDLGCGPGELEAHLRRSRPGVELLGLDISETALSLARRRAPGARFQRCDFTRPLELPEFDGWATHAVCQEVLEHLDDPVVALRNARRLLAPGCRLIITVPAGPVSAFDRHIGHRRHFTGALLRKTIEAAGLDVREIHGAGFPFFNLYRLAIVARGDRLVSDAAEDDESKLPLVAKAAMRFFGALFKLNADRTSLGWQLVAVATPR